MNPGQSHAAGCSCTRFNIRADCCGSDGRRLRRAAGGAWTEPVTHAVRGCGLLHLERAMEKRALPGPL